jgi:hypothetical protein
VRSQGALILDDSTEAQSIRSEASTRQDPPHGRVAAASRPPPAEVSRAGWAAIASAPASSLSFGSSSRSRMINSSVSAETACGL